MKRFISLLLAVLTLFSLFALTVCAQESNFSEESSDETSVSVFQEHPNKQFTWAYWLIGIFSIIAIAGICVLVTVKFKNK